MDVLYSQFRILQFFGVWYEADNDVSIVKYFWRPLNVIVTIIFTISQLGALSVYRDNVADFTECLFLSLMYLGLCIKLFNWLYRRDSMLELLEEFRKKVCLPRDDQEQEMIGKYEKVIAMIFKVMIWFAAFSGMLFLLMPLVSMGMGAPEMFLPIKTYEIIDKSDRRLYWLTYAFQVFAAVVGILSNVSFDSIVASFLLLTCGQIDLCCHRFASSRNDVIQKSTKECVVHQLLIRRIVRKLEAFFMPVVVPLLLLSLTTFCTSIYNLAQTDVREVQSVSLSVYIVCLLFQLGCYCWFGNELKIKSNAIRETIYNSDWTVLQPLDRKSLYLIMLSCQNEMTISFRGLCALTIEIFVWVLKTSYSAYNLLKTVE